MTKLLLFFALTGLTGSPALALLVLLALWWLGDRVTWRLLPDPFRWLARLRRRAELRRALELNPHDRRARFELAELLLQAGHPAEAARLLRANAEAGDDDVQTAFALGAALGRSGQGEAAERVLSVARREQAGFRAGEIDLELGRQRLQRGDRAGAREALERLLAVRPGTVEGRYFLARALDGLGLPAEAARRRHEALAEYLALPRFQRKAQRPYAWRIKPWRPALVALLVLGALALALLAAGVSAR